MLIEQAVAKHAVDAMDAQWKYKPTSKQTKAIFQSYGDAMAKSLIMSLRSVVINGGIVTGGACPPGGPVVGAVLTFAPGSALASSRLDMEAVFVPPKFEMDVGGKTVTGEYTMWLREVTSFISTSMQTAFLQWLSLWSVPGAVVAGGGIGAWIPPVPPSPPYPGPWTGGTITSPCGFNSPGFGTSLSPAFTLLPNVAIRLAKSKQIRVKVGDSTMSTKLCANEISEALLLAIIHGCISAFEYATSQVFVVDTTFSGIGTAVPPTGSIVGGTLSGCTLDA